MRHDNSNDYLKNEIPLPLVDFELFLHATQDGILVNFDVKAADFKKSRRFFSKQIRLFENPRRFCIYETPK